MSDIATALGVIKAALYKHYTSKQQILDSIVEKRYRDPELAKLYQHYLSDGPLSHMEEIFKGFTNDEGEARLRLRKDTVLINFPLFCPKCKKESLINAKEYMIRKIN